MSRTIRSSHAANEQMAQRAIAQQAYAMHVKREADDWRHVLARRDARRAAVRNQRVQTRQSGSTRVIVLTVLSAIISAVLTVVHSI